MAINISTNRACMVHCLLVPEPYGTELACTIFMVVMTISVMVVLVQVVIVIAIILISSLFLFSDYSLRFILMMLSQIDLSSTAINYFNNSYVKTYPTRLTQKHISYVQLRKDIVQVFYIFRQTTITNTNSAVLKIVVSS